MEPALVEGDFSKITVEKANMISLLKDYIAQNHVGFCVDMLSDRRFYSRPPIDAVISYGETLPGDFSTFVFVSNF
jgi:hypothetical protein